MLQKKVNRHRGLRRSPADGTQGFEGAMSTFPTSRCGPARRGAAAGLVGARGGAALVQIADATDGADAADATVTHGHRARYAATFFSNSARCGVSGFIVRMPS